MITRYGGSSPPTVLESKLKPNRKSGGACWASSQRTVGGGFRGPALAPRHLQLICNARRHAHPSHKPLQMSDPDVIRSLLGELSDPMSGGDRRQLAEAQLKAFSRSDQGLQWALNATANPAQDPQLQFYAASVLEAAVAPQRWPLLSPAAQAAVRAFLWEASTAPSEGMPAFITAKLTAALAGLACVEWRPQLWADLQVALGDAGRARAGVRVLLATVEQLHDAAQATAVGLRGKVRCVLVKGRVLGPPPLPAYVQPVQAGRNQHSLILPSLTSIHAPCRCSLTLSLSSSLV